MKILFKDNHCVGDACENIIAISHYHASNPQHGVCYRGTGEELCENIPWQNWAINEQNADIVVNISMDAIQGHATNGLHFVHCVELDICRALDCHIRPQALRLPLVFSQEELCDISVFARHGIDLARGYWVINAGGKRDFTTKHYPSAYYQRIVDATRHAIQWVQVGAKGDIHPPLKNVTNLVGETPRLRDFAKVIYFSKGVLTPLSCTMHLASMPMHRGGGIRPCVVIAGGRETPTLNAYPKHIIMHNVGDYDCCKDGGCWRSKTETDCALPCKVGGQLVPLCMAAIEPLEVAKKVLKANGGVVFSRKSV